MIRPLRRRHRVFAAGLALVVPALYVTAMRARVVVPASNALLESVSRVGPLHESGRDLAVAWDGAEVVARAFRDGAVLELEPLRDVERPDVLVYWCPTPPEGAPPPGSHLLGGLAGTQPRRYALPPEARAAAGTLLLYSLAHAEVVATGALSATAPAGGER